eukprot:Gb_20989 [translate_table: standard]
MPRLLEQLALIAILLVVLLRLDSSQARQNLSNQFPSERREVIEADRAVATDDGRCSEIGRDVIREGGHVVDAAVATTLCLGVVSPASSGLGGGAFMLVRLASGEEEAYDMRETAPALASQYYKENCTYKLILAVDGAADTQTVTVNLADRAWYMSNFKCNFSLQFILLLQNMYASNPLSKASGVLSVSVPGELAGLHQAWRKHGRLQWERLVQPAVRLAAGFTVSPSLAFQMKESEAAIFADKGLRGIFTSNGKLLQMGDICKNLKLAESLKAIAKFGPEVFYNGTVGAQLVKDVQSKGGILTVRDLQKYRVKVTDPVSADILGYKILGMPPPSSGGAGLILVLNILASYGVPSAASGAVGLHRTIEALKHMFAVRMNLGDPDFVNVSKVLSDMLSPKFAAQLRRTIYDNMTFDPSHYGAK